jgi:hypothetical protein
VQELHGIPKPKMLRNMTSSDIHAPHYHNIPQTQRPETQKGHATTARLKVNELDALWLSRATAKH